MGRWRPSFRIPLAVGETPTLLEAAAFRQLPRVNRQLDDDFPVDNIPPDDVSPCANGPPDDAFLRANGPQHAIQ